MKTLFYIVRHGHSTGNLTKTFYGHYDGPLTDIGREQAKRVKEYFRNKHIDLVYSSDLVRAVDTIKPTAVERGLGVIGDKRLREIFAGEWENRNIDALIVEYPEEYSKWRDKKSESYCTGGESVKELYNRVSQGITDIAIKNPGKTIALATHATPIMVLKPFFMGEELEKINGTPYVVNASVTVVSYEDGKWDIISYEEKHHLEGLETSLAKGF